MSYRVTSCFNCFNASRYFVYSPNVFKLYFGFVNKMNLCFFLTQKNLFFFFFIFKFLHNRDRKNRVVTKSVAIICV